MFWIENSQLARQFWALYCLHESHFLEAFCGVVTACSVYTTPHSSRPVSITQVQLPSVYELPGEQGSNMYMVWGGGTHVGGV